MVLAHCSRAFPAWLLITSLTAVVAGCSGCSPVTDTSADDEDVVAVIDGTPITARELDDALRPQLGELERSRYELRLKQLHRMIAARVLGEERAEQEGEKGFRAATAQAEVDIRLVAPTVSAAVESQAVAADTTRDGDGQAPQRSTLPLTLVGTIVRDDPAKSMAAVRVPGALLARNVQPGQTIVDGAVLLRVERNRIVLRHKGLVEFVPLSVVNAASTPTPARTMSRFTRPPDTVLSLRRNDVDRGLRDIAALERSLTRAAPELDGRRLLVLGSIEPGSLYDLLQLHERDVLMQVNGEWVDEQRNPLWDALRADATVTLLVMRAGQPQSFAYDIN